MNEKEIICEKLDGVNIDMTIAGYHYSTTIVLTESEAQELLKSLKRQLEPELLWTLDDDSWE